MHDDNNYNNEHVMHANVQFEFFGGLSKVKAHDILEENVTTRSEI